MAEPLYRQIADSLRAEIEAGQLAPDAQLPTETELQQRFSASRNTIRDAIKSLIMIGLVETRPGQGTFVAGRIEPLTTVLSGRSTGTGEMSELDMYISMKESKGRHLDVTDPQVGIQRARDELAIQLGVAKGQPVISRQQRLSIDDIPWSMQTTFYPMEFVNKGALRLIEEAHIEEGVPAYLRDAIGVTQNSSRDLIMARAPDRDEAAFFGLSGQVPVFEIQRTGFDGKGNPIRLAVIVYPADRNRFIYEEGPNPATPDGQQPLEGEIK